MSTTGVLEPDMVSLRFEALLAARRPADALELVQSQLSHHRDALFIWELLCRGFLVLERYPEAEAAGRQALLLDPESSNALINLGLALLYQGQQEEAVDLALRTVELAPDDPESHYWLGVMHLNTPSGGKPEWAAARGAALTALELNPDQADYYWLAASASGRMGAREDAARYLSDGLAVDPGNRSLLMLGTRLAGGQEVVGGEAEVLRSLLAQDPMDSQAHLLLRAQAYARLRRLAILPWLQVVFFCFLVPFVPAAAVGGAVPVALLLAFVFAWRSRRRYRKLREELPGDYIQDLQRTGPLTRLSRRLTLAGMLAVSAGTLGAAVAGAGEPLRWFLVLTVAGLLPAAAGYQLLLAGEERDGQPAGVRYQRPDTRRSNATIILAGCLLSLLTLVHGGRLVFAGASLLSLALMLAAALLGMLGRRLLTAVSLSTVVFFAAGLLAVAVLGSNGTYLLRSGGLPQPPEPQPVQEPARIPVPTFGGDPKPFPAVTLPPMPEVSFPPVPGATLPAGP